MAVGLISLVPELKLFLLVWTHSEILRKCSLLYRLNILNLTGRVDALIYIDSLGECSITRFWSSKQMNIPSALINNMKSYKEQNVHPDCNSDIAERCLL